MMYEQAECRKHRPYWWTILDPVYKDGTWHLQDVLVGACNDCGEVMPFKVLREVRCKEEE